MLQTLAVIDSQSYLTVFRNACQEKFLVSRMKETIADRLKKLKGDASLSNFARALGVPIPTLKDYLDHKYQPSVDFIKVVSEKFNISCDWLIKGEGPEPDLREVQEKIWSPKEAELVRKLLAILRAGDKHAKTIEAVILNIEEFYEKIYPPELVEERKIKVR